MLESVWLQQNIGTEYTNNKWFCKNTNYLKYSLLIHKDLDDFEWLSELMELHVGQQLY